MARLVTPVIAGDRLERAKNSYKKVTPWIPLAFAPILLFGIFYDRFWGSLLIFTVFCLGWWNIFRVNHFQTRFLLDEVHFMDDHLEVHDYKGRIITNVKYKEINAISKQTVRLIWLYGPKGMCDITSEGMIIIYLHRAVQLSDLELVQNYETKAYNPLSLLRNADCVAFQYNKKTWQWLMDNVPCPCFYYSRKAGIW